MLNNNHPTLDELRQALRMNICTHCHKRPLGSERRTSDRPRPCEPTCDLFLSLPRIHELVYLDPMISNLRQAAKHRLCETRRLNTAARENSRKSGSPLQRYQKRILETIDRMMEHARG